MSALKLAPAWRPVKHTSLGVRCYRDAFFEVDLWAAPRTVRVGGDLFAPGVPEAFIGDVFQVMEQAPEHTFLVGTTQAGRMATIVRAWRKNGCWSSPPNIWAGATLLTHLDAGAKLEALISTPAAKRFVEFLPDVQVDIDPWIGCSWCVEGLARAGGACVECRGDGRAIHWVFTDGHAEEAKALGREGVRRMFRAVVR